MRIANNKTMQVNSITYSVQEVIRENAQVVTLKLFCEDGIPSYKAGQFITIFFPETGHVEGKSYSISSSPSERTLNITVKEIGIFSKKLCAKKIGETITASLPYGYFYSESETSPLVIVTGGIGIVPFRSMIFDVLQKNPLRNIVLLYVNKTKDSIIFKQEFDELSKNSGGVFTVRYYLTKESVSATAKYGRIPVEDVIEESKHLENKEFFICGSIAFVRDYWKGLKNKAIPEESIYTEAFF